MGRTARGGRGLSWREGRGSRIARAQRIVSQVGLQERRGSDGTEGRIEAGGRVRDGSEAMHGVTLPARGWIACQKSGADACSIVVPVVCVVAHRSERTSDLKTGR